MRTCAPPYLVPQKRELLTDICSNSVTRATRVRRNIAPRRAGCNGHPLAPLEPTPMCAACGVPTHVAVLDPAGPQAAGADRETGTQPAKFAALRNPTCRVYL